MRMSIKATFLSGDSFQFSKCIFTLESLLGLDHIECPHLPVNMFLKLISKNERIGNSDLEQQPSMPAMLQGSLNVILISLCM